jgi:phosphatidylglycerophosphatase A
VTSDAIGRFIATCAYVGYLPGAPGTWASVLACILLWFVPLFTHPLLVALVAVIGFFAIKALRTGDHDPGYVVVDEFVGMQLTMAGHPMGILNLIAGFILFRAFDILKPYPIRKAERLPGAYGIIADDILAGAAASIVLFIGERMV